MTNKTNHSQNADCREINFKIWLASIHEEEFSRRRLLTATSFCHVSAFFVIFNKSTVLAWVVLIKLELLSATSWQTRKRRISHSLRVFTRACTLVNLSENFLSDSVICLIILAQNLSISHFIISWHKPYQTECSSSCHLIAHKFPDKRFCEHTSSGINISG